MSASSAKEQYLAYPFDTDEAYQQGLASILAQNSLNEDGLRQTRVFYFNRYPRVSGQTLSPEEVKEAEMAQDPTPSVDNDSATQQAPPLEERVLSFQELQALIESGKVDQIPNNKLIPEAFNENPASQSNAAVRKKPWETSDPTVPAT